MKRDPINQHRKQVVTKNHPERAQRQLSPRTNTMKRTKKELKERKAKAAEIAAMYVTVASGGRMQYRGLILGKVEWVESCGPNLNCDLSNYRVIPAPKKPEPKLTGPGGGERWIENAGPRVKGKRTKYRALETTTTKKKP